MFFSFKLSQFFGHKILYLGYQMIIHVCLFIFFFFLLEGTNLWNFCSIDWDIFIKSTLQFLLSTLHIYIMTSIKYFYITCLKSNVDLGKFLVRYCLLKTRCDCVSQWFPHTIALFFPWLVAKKCHSKAQDCYNYTF